MADSPNANASDVLTLAIKLNGEDSANELQVVSVSIHKAINRIARATVVVLDGDMPNQTFPNSDGDASAPGTTVEISAGYGGNTEVIFSGLVLKQSIRINGQNQSLLTLECQDEAVKMTLGRNNANFVALSSGDEIKDSDVMTTILGNYSGITPDIEATTTVHSSLVQFAATDWDFVLSRAEANGMILCCEDGNLAVKKPDFSTDALLTVSYGIDLMEFNGEVDARNQLSQVTSRSWDPKTLALLEQTVSAESDSSSQGQKNGDLSEVMGLSDFVLQTSIANSQDALSDWSNGQLTKSRMAALKGSVVFQGNASPKLATTIELVGVGERYSGNVFCSAIEHTIESGGWTTRVEFGCEPKWLIGRDLPAAPKAAGLLPGVEGLQVGIVKQLDEDPESQHRVLVSLPLLKAETEGVWARLIQPYASAGFGHFFIPEIGDEVVLGYFNNDPGHPVILGSLYSQKNAPPEELTADNFIKTWVTKSQLKIRFDDDKKILTFETPGGHSFVMDDDQQSVTLTDSNNNVVTLDSSGISLSSPGDIELKADGNVKLTAGANVEGNATGDVKLSGMNADISANTAFSAQGNASAEVSASGNTTIKGAMVMIN